MEGTEKVETSLLTGEVSAVLLYVARRFAYEIDMPHLGDLLGHTTYRAMGVAFESDHLSGTTLAVRPLFHPLGAQPGNGRWNELAKDVAPLEGTRTAAAPPADESRR
ncbi:hypothetical protein P8A18_22030 [Streptomyces castrisilvae]|uniref:Uncharacterized protein n=1 Tax=Streptomyces castrisilvae TaxID=3033811 RepID=A0ABY9HN27_9ACTN|nr:hypothetical protein [Streptomyces sp. Mut1]WLQ35940.1 hypothetical protein P8A18_22030 [Streptomyces sp. Mut1]